MRYRNWTIKAYPTYLGYLAHYISPIGHAHNTSGCFATEEQAHLYVQALIDNFLEKERAAAPALEAAG